MQNNQKIFEKLNSAIERIGVFDVHEHLLGRNQRQERDPDLFEWIAESYLWGDLVAAGMDPSVLSDQNILPQDKWVALKKYLPAVKHSGYMEVCRYAFCDLFGMTGSDLNDENWQRVDDAVRKNNNDKALTEDILVEKCSMRHVLVDCQVGGTLNYFCTQNAERDWYKYLLNIRPGLSDDLIEKYTKVRETHAEYLHRVVKADSLMWGWLKQSAFENLKLVGVDISSSENLDTCTNLIDSAIQNLAKTGAVGLKSTMSTWRSHELPEVDPEIAEEALVKSVSDLTPENLKAFENFAFEQIVKAAGKYNLPLQIHTGTGFGPGGRASCRKGAADHLADIVQKYDQTTFVLMHASWPYWGEIEQMAKRFPNVILDLSWTIMSSPVEATRMLESLFTSVPVSKLLWGGDCVYVEESYGVLIQAKRVVSAALSNLVMKGMLDIDEAVELALKLFCTNGLTVYSSISNVKTRVKGIR